VLTARDGSAGGVRRSPRSPTLSHRTGRYGMMRAAFDEVVSVMSVRLCVTS
jgi:hypothetical protein